MMKLNQIPHNSVFLIPIFFLSGCVSLGPDPTPVAVRSNIDIQKFSDCLAPLSASVEPAFQQFVGHVRSHPLASDRPYSEMMRPLLELNADLIQNKWDVQSRIESLIAKLATNIKILKPSGELIGAASENVMSDIKKDIESGKDDVNKAVLRSEAYLLAYFKKSASQTQLYFNADAKDKLAAKLA